MICYPQWSFNGFLDTLDVDHRDRIRVDGIDVKSEAVIALSDRRDAEGSSRHRSGI